MTKKQRIIVLIILSFLLVGLVALLIIKLPNRTEAQEVSNIKSRDNKLTLTMVGDNLIHGAVYRTSKTESGYDFNGIFANVKSEIENSDLAIINQETILVDEAHEVGSYPRFGTPEEMGHAIVNAGFDVVAHATNHTNDKGVEGISGTLDFWKTNYPEMKILGIHRDKEESDIVYVEKNNIKVAFVNYTYGLNGLALAKENKHMVDMLGNKGEIAETLKEAKANSDILIPILHIGTEYVYEPSTYHKNYVDFFIDNGADIILCAHPHVLEPYGMVTTKNNNTALVYYSLGNFVSAQDQMPRMLGGMAKIELEKENGEVKIKTYDMIPLVTHYDNNHFTTYKLENYTDELASKHKLGLTVEKLNDLYNDIMNK